MQITSESFQDSQAMPVEHSVDGEGSLPPLKITEVPNEAVSLAITVHDPDAPRDRWPGGNFDHWVVWNLPADTRDICNANDHQGIVGMNSADANDWYPAGPPPNDGPHRYYFVVYALSSMLDLAPNSTRADLDAAMNGHVIESAQLMGTFRR